MLQRSKDVNVFVASQHCWIVCQGLVNKSLNSERKCAV